MKLLFRSLVAPSLLLAACATDGPAPAPDATTRIQQVVYGVDDRTDWYAETDEALRTLTQRSIVALIGAGNVDESDPANVRIRSRTLGEARNLCESERFRDQPAAANCSGTLIGTDLVMTAGHCVDDRSDCQGYRYVFDYFYRDEGTLEPITADDVYRCDDIVVRELRGGVDYAILRLDRPVSPERRPAPIRPTSEPLEAGEPLVIIGFGSGLPAKIDAGGVVLDPRTDEGIYFDASLDAFGGNSGSGVFDAAGRAVGILVRGATDYSTSGGCTRVAVLPENRDEDGFGEDVVYASRAVGALCGTGYEGLPCTPGEPWCQRCEPAPADADGLVSLEGSGVEADVECAPGWRCATPGADLPATCVLPCAEDADCADSHVCGPAGVCVASTSSRCDGGDVWGFDSCGRRLGVVTECGEQQTCPEADCVDAGAGNSCATADSDAVAIETVDQTLTATFDAGYDNRFTGSCGGAGPDRVWTFTLTDPAAFSALADGDDPVLYLRASCDDGESELACNDDIVRREDRRSQIRADLEPGTYTLVLDTYGTAPRGEFTVDVEFAVDCPCLEGDQRCDGEGLLLCTAGDGACPSFNTRRACSLGQVCWDGECVRSEAGDRCDSARELLLGELMGGDLSFGHGNTVVGACGAEGRDDLFVLDVDRVGTLSLELETPGAALSVWRGCGDRGEELACESGDGAEVATLEIDLEPGRYYVAADTLGAEGTFYVLFADFASGCVDACDVDGAVQCVTASAERVCGDVDGDGCRDWSEPQACPDGEVCLVGQGGCAPPVEPDAGGDDVRDTTDVSVDADVGEGSADVGVIVDVRGSSKSGCAAASGAAPLAAFLPVLAAVVRRRRVRA